MMSSTEQVPKIPPEVAITDLNRRLAPVLGDPQQGKVRDTYDLGEYIMPVVTDRMSAFNVVWPMPIPNKGRCLNWTDQFWEHQIFRPLGIPTDFVAGGAAIDNFLPLALRGDTELQSRATIRRKMDMIMREFV